MFNLFASSSSKKVAHEIEREKDPYQWMRDAKVQSEGIESNPKIGDHILLEREYAQSILDTLEPMQLKLYNEMEDMMPDSEHIKNVYKETADYCYYSRTSQDKYYPTYYYKSKTSAEAPEVVVLDVNQLRNRDGVTPNVSNIIYLNPDHTQVAYHMNYKGDIYTIKVLNLTTNTYSDEIPCTVNDNIVWKKDGSGFFYTTINPHTLTSEHVKYHILGFNSQDDRVIVESKDPTLTVYINNYSESYLFISKESLAIEREVWMVSLENEELPSKLIQSIQEGVFYQVHHNDKYFYMFTNQHHHNLGIKRCVVTDLDKGIWEDYISPEPIKSLVQCEYTRDFIILNYRDQGLNVIKVHNLNDRTEKTISFADISVDAAYTANIEFVVFEENKIMVSYSSLSIPKTICEFDFESGILLSPFMITETPSSYNPAAYTVERISGDNEGIKVPISLIYKTDTFKKDGSNPLYITGYGASRACLDPWFCPEILSLLNRGFIYAIAHVRGGSELGMKWYQDASLLNKKNTFEDFIKCKEKLIEENYTSKGNIVASGVSAGGLLVGAVANMRPELYKVIVANVPFVDALNTLCDPTLPLTEVSWAEFGNPHDPQYYACIKSYSPYDNVKKQDYPNMYITTGLKDQRVGYWEPMKWVAKLREMKTDKNQIVLRILGGGHDCAQNLFETASEYAFILKKFGLCDDVVEIGASVVTITCNDIY